MYSKREGCFYSSGTSQRTNVQPFQLLTTRFVFPSMLRFTCINPPRACATVPGRMSIFSRIHRERLRTVYVTPSGDRITQINALRFVSNGPAIGLFCAATVPFLRFSVCPSLARLAFLSALHRRGSPVFARLALLIRQGVEHVTFFELGGVANSDSQITQCFVFRVLFTIYHPRASVVLSHSASSRARFYHIRQKEADCHVRCARQ